MADAPAQQQRQTQAISTPFPTPPPFYTHLSKANRARLRVLQKEAGPSQPLDPASLPPELRFQIPPEPPAEGKYRSFGHAIDLSAPEPTLADSGIDQLYPADPSVRLNPQPHLIALARSLLTTFLALTGILSQNPELFQSKTQDLQTIVYNMHDLINQYRPHQARESLILLMEERIERLREEMKEIVGGQDRMRQLLVDLQQIKPVQNSDEVVVKVEAVKSSQQDDRDEEKTLKRQQRDAWASLADLVP